MSIEDIEDVVIITEDPDHNPVTVMVADGRRVPVGTGYAIYTDSKIVFYTSVSIGIVHQSGYDPCCEVVWAPLLPPPQFNPHLRDLMLCWPLENL